MSKKLGQLSPQYRARPSTARDSHPRQFFPKEMSHLDLLLPSKTTTSPIHQKHQKKESPLRRAGKSFFSKPDTPSTKSPRSKASITQTEDCSVKASPSHSRPKTPITLRENCSTETLVDSFYRLYYQAIKSHQTMYIILRLSSLSLQQWIGFILPKLTHLQNKHKLTSKKSSMHIDAGFIQLHWNLSVAKEWADAINCSSRNLTNLFFQVHRQLLMFKQAVTITLVPESLSRRQWKHIILPQITHLQNNHRDTSNESTIRINADDIQLTWKLSEPSWEIGRSNSPGATQT